MKQSHNKNIIKSFLKINIITHSIFYRKNNYSYSNILLLKNIDKKLYLRWLFLDFDLRIIFYCRINDICIINRIRGRMYRSCLYVTNNDEKYNTP